MVLAEPLVLKAKLSYEISCGINQACFVLAWAFVLFWRARLVSISTTQYGQSLLLITYNYLQPLTITYNLSVIR